MGPNGFVDAWLRFRSDAMRAKVPPPPAGVSFGNIPDGSSTAVFDSALVEAARRFENNLTLTGPMKFKERALRRAVLLGIEIDNPELASLAAQLSNEHRKQAIAELARHVQASRDWLRHGADPRQEFDCETLLNVTRDEARDGVIRTVTFDVTDGCVLCRGSGKTLGMKCISCRGAGTVETALSVLLVLSGGLYHGLTFRVPGYGRSDPAAAWTSHPRGAHYVRIATSADALDRLGRGTVTPFQASIDDTLTYDCWAHRENCPACGAAGVVNGVPCARCDGTARIDVIEENQVTIAAPLRLPAKVRLEGRGDVSCDGCYRGSLVITLGLYGSGTNYLIDLDVPRETALRGGVIAFSGGAWDEPCLSCGMSGLINGQACRVCDGSGWNTVSREARVRVDAGAAEGETIRLSGLGGPRTEAGDPSLSDGDLVFTLRISSGETVQQQSTIPAVRRAAAPQPERSRTDAAEGDSSTDDVWGGIELAPDVKASLRKWVRMFDAGHPAAPRGLLLCGPPGTGKTLLARTVARASNSEFFPTSVSDLKADIVGGTGQLVRALWERARESGRAIIFVDECESVFGRRGGVQSDAFSQELVQEFLSQWDGMGDSRTIWVVGATNRRELIDEAMISRFGAELLIGAPTEEARRKILALELERCSVSLEIDDEMIGATAGLSGRDLRTISETVAREAFDELTLESRPSRAMFLKAVADIRKRGNASVSHRSTWESLVLRDDTKKQLRAVCEMMRRADEFQKLGIDLPTGILLVGPPGTGKTEIARTLANESKLAFVATKSTDFVGGYIGWSGKMTAEVFQRARASLPGILFIDELDAIAPARSGGDSTSFQREVVGSLLQELDGIHALPGALFVLAATNELEAIDPAIRSRFARVIEIPLPDHDQRLAIVKIRLAGKPLGFDLDAGAAEIAGFTDGASGRDLVKLVETAQQAAIVRMTDDASTQITLLLEDFRYPANGPPRASG